MVSRIFSKLLWTLTIQILVHLGFEVYAQSYYVEFLYTPSGTSPIDVTIVPDELAVAVEYGNNKLGYANGMNSGLAFATGHNMAMDCDYDSTAGIMYIADSGNSRFAKNSGTSVVNILAINGIYGVAVNGTGVVAYSSNSGVTIYVSTFGASVSTVLVLTSAKITSPKYIVFDSAGNMFFTDGNIVRKYSPTGVLTTVAGSGSGATSDGQGTTASFNNPQGVAVDTLGNLFVNEYTGKVIRRISITGYVSTIAGTGAAGSGNGFGTVATFSGLYGIDFSPASGNLYVADWASSTVRKVIICPVGSAYNSVSRVCAYSTCGAGYELISTQCYLCANGKYKTGSGSSACVDCGLGFESLANRTGCVSCIAGTTYRSNSTQIGCQACPAYATCTATAGFTCNLGYKINSGATGCDVCPLNQESSSDRTTCNACTSNKYYSLSQLTCVTCPINSYCNGVSFTCNMGYTINASYDGCTICIDGTYKPTTGNSICLACNAGTQSNASKIGCDNCPAGKFIPTDLWTKSCADCPPYAVCNTTSIVSCEAGYKINSFRDSCEQCPVGQQSAADSQSCVPCSGLTFRSSLSQSYCQACPSNSACVNSTSFSCTAGYEVGSDGLSCSLCSDGNFKAGSGNVACTACAVGSESASSRQSCVSCTAGKYRPSTLFNKCIPCPQNAICSTSAITACVPGYKLNAAGDGCDQCAVGQQSNAGFTACVPCTAGTNYRSSLAQTTCVACPTNAACTATGFTCNAGYEPTGDGLGCSQCQDGFSKAAAGNSACAQCAIGTESSTDKLSCATCITGKYRPSVSISNKCVPCPQNANCTAMALTCNLGFKLNLAGDGCDQCAIGQESNVGRSACVSCSSGINFRSTLSQTGCQSCPSNSACTNTGFTCNAGYEPTSDGTNCAVCQEGYSKATAGNAACTQCVLGTESASSKQSCVACAAGKYRSSFSFNKCIPCPPYGVCTTSTFTKCLNGYKKNAAGDGCDQCPIGQDSTDGLTCVGCQAGNFKPSQDFATCIACPYGSSCGGSSISCQSGYYFDTNSQCKRNDTFFAMQQVSSAAGSATTVTAFLTLTQTSTSTTTSVSTNTITTTSTQVLTATSTTTETATSTSIQVQTTVQTSTTTETSVSVSTVSQIITISGMTILQQQFVTVTTTGNDYTQTVTVSDGPQETVSQKQSAQSANFVTLDNLGTLPISPLIFGIISFCSGFFAMLIMALVCCRRSSARRKDEELEVGMTTATSASGMNNTTSQRTFTVR